MTRRLALPFTLLLASTLLLVAASRDTVARAEAPLWHDDFKAALQAARDQDKPVFLVFRCVP